MGIGQWYLTSKVFLRISVTVEVVQEEKNIANDEVFAVTTTVYLR